mmetsp:Transcript_7154/g.8935  ORF Transcript_7154/g.8935 Transcript_7154/m.8935 type:complete len:80 (-) Transcript_7154:1446-1685(-)
MYSTIYYISKKQNSNCNPKIRLKDHQASDSGSVCSIVIAIVRNTPYSPAIIAPSGLSSFHFRYMIEPITRNTMIISRST